MINILAVIFCGVATRLDGKGKDDPTFLPFSPFNRMYGWSLNYARYAIGPIVCAITHNPWHLVTYTLASSIPYGEKHPWMRYGTLSWFGIGLIWGGASLSWGVALWLGLVVSVSKMFDIDQANLEFFVLGCGSVSWLLFK